MKHLKSFFGHNSRTGFSVGAIVAVAFASVACLYGLMSGLCYFMKWAYLAGYAHFEGEFNELELPGRLRSAPVRSEA